MKEFNAAHLEVKKDFTEDFVTHPFESGWADEAIFYVMVEAMSGGNAMLKGEVELSHDGIHWAEEGTSIGPITKAGLHFVRVKHFGNWLRLNCQVSGEKPVFRLLIQIALKG